MDRIALGTADFQFRGEFNGRPEAGIKWCGVAVSQAGPDVYVEPVPLASLQGRLKPWYAQIFATASICLPVKMGEYNFMGEE